jgi:hypothetical protein
MTPAALPSSAARELVRGAYDLHVHVAPDIIPRRISDVALARRFATLGLGGFALKSHYAPTAERAEIVRELVPEVDVIGAITLNSGVGGLNVVAVEIAARAGARIVWLPTFDAKNETAGRVPPPPGAKLPVWAQLQHELRAAGVNTPVVEVLTEQGIVRPETVAVLAAVARHNLVLATGHLSRDEIFAIVEAAKAQGVQQIVITHPEFPSQNLSIEDQCALADTGAWLERCFGVAHVGRVSWDRMIEITRAIGPARTFLSSDLGQLDNPPVEDGLALFVSKLMEAGLREQDIHTMAVVNTRHIALHAAIPDREARVQTF